VRANKKPSIKSDKTQAIRSHKRGIVGYSRKTALLEEAITQMNAGKYGRSSAALKELLTLDPNNMEARRLFATLHLRLGSLIPARQAFDALINEAFQRQDYWLAESLLREYLAAGPRCVPFLEKLGALYQEKGDALEAVAEYGKAIDILIEDPDPDNPDHAARLYEKIRGLAPASPVAFRLASLFDAQTGELLVRRPSDPGPSTVPPPLDVPEGGQAPEPMDGVMPWEILDPPVAVPDALPGATVSDVSTSLVSSATTDDAASLGPTSDVASMPSDPPVRERKQAVSHASELGGDAPEEIGSYGLESNSSEARMDNGSGQVDLRDSPPVASVSMPAAGSSETQLQQDTAMPQGDPVAAEKQDRLLIDAEPETLNDASGPSMFSVPQEPSVSSAQSFESASVMTSFRIEEVTASPLLEAELPTAGPIEAEDRQPSLLQLATTDSKEIPTEQPQDTGDSLSPEPVSASEISEPWKQPGFSWESVFNKAWKFGRDHSATVSSPELSLTNADEASTQASPATPLQEQVFENQAVEIPEREEHEAIADPTDRKSQIVPMPWDQVLESAISILQTKTDQPVAESTEPTPDLSVDQAQPLPWPDVSAAETDTFSIARTPLASISAEPESAADLGQVSGPPTSDFTFVKPEQPPAVSSLTVDEPPPFDAPMGAAKAAQVLENGSVADDVEAPTVVPPQSVDSVLITDDDRPIVVVQSAVEGPSLTPPQPTSEPLSGTTEEIAPSQPLLEEQSVCEPPLVIADTQHCAEETPEALVHEPRPKAKGIDNAPILTAEPVARPVPEWVKAGESIRFVEQPQTFPATPMPPSISERQEVSRSMAAAAAAVDVLFESSQNVRAAQTREPIAESKPGRKFSPWLMRARIAIVEFVGSCFSTTRAIVMTCVGLVVLSGVFIALGIGAIGLTWIIMEESPSPVFQSLTVTPQSTLSDYKKNGYFLLLGIDTSFELDPIQAGYDRKLEGKNGNPALECFGSSGARTPEGSTASANVMRGWIRGADPIGEFKSHKDTIKGWSSQHQVTLNRYSQWQKLHFEDWGYGQPGGPPCGAMAFAHQLHVADGFVQGTDLGVDRLETDMEAWRIVLGQARTLAVKMLALQAINDNIAVASGLLVRSDFDGKYLRQLTNILRPLDQAELSMRWPMQSELVSASKTYKTRLKAARAEDQPVYTMVVSALPLPMQRRLNDYAEYYDASYKAAGEGKYGSLPKWKTYIRFPASGLMDYFINPIENIVGLEPLAPWDLYNGFVVDTDAHLRLASLQAWLRRSFSEGDLHTRIAKAGQNFYDPYTGLPMLVNMKKSLLYSVGHDGKDQDADPQADVVVEIPVIHAPAAPAKPSAASPKPR
jgi:hypothetical protein